MVHIKDTSKGFLRKVGIVALAIGLMSAFVSLNKIYNLEVRATNALSGNAEIVTINDTTDGLEPNNVINPLDYSTDGNVILFLSNATNLVGAGGNSGVMGIYTYNIQTGTTSRVNLSTNGVYPDAGNMMSIQLSGTGRYVIFGSLATNLIDDGVSRSPSYYKRDTQTGTTTLVAGLSYSNGYIQNMSRNLAVSDDGQYTLMSSRYINGAYPYPYNIVYGELNNNTYTWTTLGYSAPYQGANGNKSIVGDLSCNGEFAVYQESSSLYLSDMRNSTKKITAANANSTSPILSCNGRYILYATNNKTDIPQPLSGTNLQLVRYDRITGNRTYVNTNTQGSIVTSRPYSSIDDAPQNTFNASISDTGDVVFKDGNTFYVKHMSDNSRSLEPIAKKPNGVTANTSDGKITSDGRYIFFKADAFELGLSQSSSGIQLIRVKTNI